MDSRKQNSVSLVARGMMYMAMHERDAFRPRCWLSTPGGAFGWSMLFHVKRTSSPYLFMSALLFQKQQVCTQQDSREVTDEQTLLSWQLDQVCGAACTWLYICRT